MLIDADNVSPKYIKSVLEEMSVYGTVTYKRMYGDWTDASKQKGWKDISLEHSVNPMQQYSYTSGKNSSDSALIIDAMDILYSGNVDGFCLVSSDSDFTKLAQRLREAGMHVIGMGESKTPKPFRTACEVFKILDVITRQDDEPADSSKKKPATAKKAVEARDGAVNDITGIDEIKDAVHKIITDNINSGRTTALGELGTILNKNFSDFDVRNYGFSKLSTFIESLADFTITKTPSGGYIVSDKAASIPLSEIEEFIENLLQQNGGRIDNLSLVKEEITKKFPSFRTKDYGFSRFSSFISSFDSFGVVGNSIRPRRSR